MKNGKDVKDKVVEKGEGFTNKAGDAKDQAIKKSKNVKDKVVEIGEDLTDKAGDVKD